MLSVSTLPPSNAPVWDLVSPHYTLCAEIHPFIKRENDVTVHTGGIADLFSVH